MVPRETTLLYFPAHKAHGVAGGWQDVHRTVDSNADLRCADNRVSPDGRSSRRRLHGRTGRHLAAVHVALSTVIGDTLLQSTVCSQTPLDDEILCELSLADLSLNECTDSAATDDEL